MNKSSRRRPEFESLESVMLLSTLVATAHYAGPLPLTGTLQANVNHFSKPLSGAINRLTGPGATNLNPGGGSVLARGHMQSSVALASPITRSVRGASTVSTPLGVAANNKVATPIRSTGPALSPLVGTIARPSSTIKGF